MSRNRSRRCLEAPTKAVVGELGMDSLLALNRRSHYDID
jgi:hypothetical protein